MNTEQNRNDSPAPKPTPNPHDQPGSAQGERMSKVEVANQTDLERQDVANLRDVHGALSGRQDLAGGSAGDKTESDGNIKNTEDTRGGRRHRRDQQN